MFMTVLRQRAQHGRAQRRRQHQRDQHRQHHRGHDRDRELPIDDAGGAAEKRHRQEHRGQHQRDADQRALDLAHRTARRLLRRQSFLGHQPLDVLHDHDGIVDQQSDRQHHAEHRQRIDRIAERRQHAEGAEQHHRHRNGRNQRGAHVLQEQIHHQEHQHDGFDQRAHDAFDRRGDHRRGVVRIDHLHARRKERLKLAQRRADGLGGIERVGAAGEPDRDAGGRPAVVLGIDVVVLPAEADLGHVLEPDLRAVAVDLEQDLAELLGRLQARLAHHRRVQLLAGDRRQPTQLAGGHLHVLRLDRGPDVGRRQLIRGQPRRIEPDPHRVLRAEYLEVADARRARQRVLDVRHDVVGKVLARHAAVARHHADDHQEVAHRLGHADALLLHLLRQQRRGELQLVLDLHLRDVRIGALLERDGDGHVAVAVALGGDVAQAVQPIELLFDDLHHGVLHGLRRGAGVVDLDRDGRRRDGRILADRQRADRQRARQHDHHRDDPGEDRAFDKEAGHRGAPFNAARRRRAPGWPRLRRRARWPALPPPAAAHAPSCPAARTAAHRRSGARPVAGPR